MLPVRVVPYDPAWPEMFERERTAIDAALGELTMEIEHSGSTSVPGLIAKPKIDPLIGLTSWDDLDTVVEALIRIGYEREPQLPIPRHFAVRRGRPTTHRAHLVERDGGQWSELLAFRDALRADPDLSARYGALKQELALRHADDLSHKAYVDGKAPFIEAVLAQLRRSWERT